MSAPGSTSSKDTVIAHVVDQGGSEAYKRVVAYAKEKNISEHSEMWQWAEVLGFAASIFEEMPKRMEAKMAAALNAHEETIQAGKNKLVDAGAREANRAKVEIGKAQEAAETDIKKTGVQVFNDIKKDLPEVLRIGVYTSFIKPFNDMLKDMADDNRNVRNALVKATEENQQLRFEYLLYGIWAFVGGCAVSSIISFVLFKLLLK